MGILGITGTQNSRVYWNDMGILGITGTQNSLTLFISASLANDSKI